MYTSPVISKGFFLALVLAVGWLFWRIVEPYVLVVIMAAMAAVVCVPIQRWLIKRLMNERVCSAIVVSGVFALVFIPLVFGVVVAGAQAADLVQNSLDNQAWRVWVQSASSMLPDWVPQPSVFLADVDVAGMAKAIAIWAAKHAQTIVSGTAEMAMNTLIFFITLYYFLADRDRMVRALLSLSPFDDATDKRLLTRLADTVRHVAFGALVISVVKGILSGIGFAVFGVPGAFVWAIGVAVASQVPLVGAGLVMIPAVLYLLIIGHTGAAIGLAIWGIILVGLIDNVLSPILLEGRTNMHALLILLSILGGLQAFGWIGFIVGPTILAAMLALVDLYRSGILQSASTGRK